MTTKKENWLVVIDGKLCRRVPYGSEFPDWLAASTNPSAMIAALTSISSTSRAATLNTAPTAVAS